MLKKKTIGVIFILFAIVFCRAFAQDNGWVTLEEGIFSTTQVYTPSQNKPLSLESAIEMAISFGSFYPDNKDVQVKFYNLNSIASAKEFQVIYDVIINSLTKLHYCIVTQSSEKQLELFITINDGRVLYAKIIA